jgi:hypothetical protein
LATFPVNPTSAIFQTCDSYGNRKRGRLFGRPWNLNAREPF